MNVIRRNAKRGGLVAAALVLIVLIALFVKAYQDASPSSPNAGAGGSGSPSPGTASPSASGQPGKPATLLGLPATLPPYTLHPGEPGGFVFADIPKHTLVLTVTSAGPIGKLGYIAPTSQDHAYGTATAGTSWVLQTYVTGKPYYAAIFIQAGRAGVPIRCTISIDGHVDSSATTSGPYGRQVCVG